MLSDQSVPQRPPLAQMEIPVNISDRTAQLATRRSTLSFRHFVLLGTFGTDANKQALLRSPAGHIRRIGVGDSFGLGRVIDIEDGRLLFMQNGEPVWLELPTFRAAG